MLKSPEMVKTALLIVDMINNFDFPEGKALHRQALPIAKKIARLKARFEKLKMPVIYVNDNYGDWRADWKKIYKKCTDESSRGREIAEMVKPTEDDLFVLKPRHSGFHQTPLQLLLESLKVKRVVVTGLAGNMCVLFTAHDAHSRGFEVVVPRDCVASNTSAQNRAAISQLKEALKLRTPLSASVP